MGWLAVAVTLGCLTGCVDRRFVITTDPPAAIVFDEKNQPMGGTPADRQFTYYGKYRFTLVHDGYETMIVEENVRPPWYEIIGLDFVSEILLPLNLRDVRRFHYVMQTTKMVPEDAVLGQGVQLREKGKLIGSPLPPRFPMPESAPAPRPVVPGTQPSLGAPQPGFPPQVQQGTLVPPATPAGAPQVQAVPPS
jgi:hypothetical protein